MGRWSILLVVLALALSGCSDSVDVSFEFHAETYWSDSLTPEVTSVTIDGTPYASGQTLELDWKFPSYEDAKATFVPLPVVVTTATGTLTAQLTFGLCETVRDFKCDPRQPHCSPITRENDHIILSYGYPVGSKLSFGADGGACEFADHYTSSWAARTEPGR